LALHKQAMADRKAREPPPLPVDYGSVIRPERVASARQRGASTHPGILKRRRGNSYLWDASPGIRLWVG
jgi:hypothetical protein